MQSPEIQPITNVESVPPKLPSGNNWTMLLVGGFIAFLIIVIFALIIVILFISNRSDNSNVSDKNNTSQNQKDTDSVYDQDDTDYIEESEDATESEDNTDSSNDDTSNNQNNGISSESNLEFPSQGITIYNFAQNDKISSPLVIEGMADSWYSFQDEMYGEFKIEVIDENEKLLGEGRATAQDMGWLETGSAEFKGTVNFNKGSATSGYIRLMKANDFSFDPQDQEIVLLQVRF